MRRIEEVVVVVCLKELLYILHDYKKIKQKKRWIGKMI